MSSRYTPLSFLLVASAICVCVPAHANGHDYPTETRVEYVIGCMAGYADQYAGLGKCSCAIDYISKEMTNDDYVEAKTYERYVGLSGERGSILRDSKSGRALVHRLRETEASAEKACGITRAPAR